jgi:4-hydroxy-tetrahydrodipicolinate reductase
MKTHIAINGACGRMGQRLVALSREDPELKLVAAVDWPGHSAQGRDAGELAGVGPLSVPITAALALDARP